MFKEFKEFAIKGNVVDLAVGVVIGAAFGKIVASFVADVVMPIVGYFAGGTDFANMFAVLGSPAVVPTTLEAAKEAGIATVNYGVFINTVVDFFIIALAVFVAVKAISKMQKAKEEAAPAAPAADVVLLEEIRDLLKK